MKQNKIKRYPCSADGIYVVISITFMHKIVKRSGGRRGGGGKGEGKGLRPIPVSPGIGGETDSFYLQRLHLKRICLITLQHDCPA